MRKCCRTYWVACLVFWGLSCPAVDSYAQSSSNLELKEKPRKKVQQPVVFRPKGTKPINLKPRAKLPFRSVAIQNQSRKQVVVLPSSMSNFKTANQAILWLRKYIPNAPNKELALIAFQMIADRDKIPPGLGGVFVPNIIKNRNVAPASYSLFDKYNQPVAITETGKKSFVQPGLYTVRIGRLANGLLPTFKVRVRSGKMTLIRPNWAALIIRVVDERLIQFRGTYDLINLTRRTPIGTGIGADGELGEKVRPWLIPAGAYMIVRVGDSYLARTNYFTVQVDPGKVTRFRLVINKNTGQFLGGGVVLQKSKRFGDSGWRWSIQLNGNVLLNYANNLVGSSNGISFSMAAFLFNRVLYSRDQHFFSTTLNAEIGFTLPPQGVFRKGADRLELQAIYVYRLLPWLGPYLRAGFETVMLPDRWIFTDEDKFTRQDVSIYQCVSVTCQLQQSVSVTNGQALPQLELSSGFDPVLLKQGLGVNIQPVTSTWINLRLLFGVGFRQEITRGVFQFDPNTDVYTTRCKNTNSASPNPTDLSSCPRTEDQERHTSVLLYNRSSSHREGLEIATVATGQITRFVSYTFEFDALAPFEFSDKATIINFDNVEVDVRLTVILRLSHYASLNLRLRVRRNPNLTPDPNDSESKRWSIDLSNALSFSLLF